MPHYWGIYGGVGHAEVLERFGAGMCMDAGPSLAKSVTCSEMDYCTKANNMQCIRHRHRININKTEAFFTLF